jgi:hypothetical protein
MKRLTGIAGALLLLWIQSASAALVVTDFKFFGVDVSPLGDPGTVNLVVRLSYDSTQVDGDLADNTLGVYTGNLRVLSGGQTAGPVGVTITVRNEIADVFLVPASFGSPFPSLGGNQFSTAELEISSATGSLFSSDALPLDTTFAHATDANLLLHFGKNDSSQSLEFDSFEIVAVPNAVPEPATYALLIAGLAGIFAFRRTRGI